VARLLFVGGPLHGRLALVPAGAWTYAIPDPAEVDWSAFLRGGEMPPSPAPIVYQLTAWPYAIAEELAASDVDHKHVMLGPITEDRPAPQDQDGRHPVYAHTADQMWRIRAEDLIPQCVVPDCGEKGRYVFIADECGRLAGREWNRGDRIRVCPAHAHDIYRAQGVYGIEQLAEWLRPDAILDRIDAYDAGHDLLYWDQIVAARSRMLRLAVNARG
jgi:hypothetical protein